MTILMSDAGATLNGLVAVAMGALGLLLGLIFWLKKSEKRK